MNRYGKTHFFSTYIYGDKICSWMVQYISWVLFIGHSLIPSNSLSLGSCCCFFLVVLHIAMRHFQSSTKWVSFPRTGKMSVLREFFFKSRRLVWLNQTILTTSVDLWWLIMTFSFWKSWIWLLLSKKNTFYCTLNLTQFSNFTVTLTLSCYQTWWDGLDLTCPSFRGLNFDDFPFFLDLRTDLWKPR